MDASPAKRAKTTPAKTRKTQKLEDEDGEETYHFIGYVPAYGKVWELDGLKSGPLEVGELPSMTTSPNLASTSASTSTPFTSASNDQSHTNIQTQTNGWMDVVRPALRMKMQKYGGAAEGGNNIRFSLLAIVDGLYERASDDLEFLKREKGAIERRLGVGWEETVRSSSVFLRHPFLPSFTSHLTPLTFRIIHIQVDPTLLASAAHAFTTSTRASSPGKTFARDFGVRTMQRHVEILDMPDRNLVTAWEDCVRNAMRAKLVVEDEVAKALRDNVRCFSPRGVSLAALMLTSCVGMADRPYQTNTRLRAILS